MQPVKLTGREEVAKRTMAFRFQKPEGFDFRAGQFIEIKLIEPPETDWEGDLRKFTITSAPFEDDLMIATRLRDTAFKRVLRAMPLGAKVNVGGPYGSFTLHPDASRPAAFLAGGIGVTPFRSIVLQATREALPHRLFLFYSNRGPEDAAFLEELGALERKNPRFSFMPTMTHMDSSSQLWSGRTGYIDRAMVEKAVGHLDSPIYYIAGPPRMVDAMRRMLREAGIGADSVRSEAFSGYN